MKYYVITADYNYENNDINLYVRDENGKKDKKIITNFHPYFYTNPKDAELYRGDSRVSEIENTDFKFVDDKSDLVRVVTHKPKFVGDIRKEFKIPAYEADILFPRRFMIDHKILRSLRGFAPIVASPRHIVWVAGWRVDERVKITERTQHVLHLVFRLVDSS